jgi:hypothetical protein
MAQVYKLVHGIDKVERIKLFDHVQEGRTRLAADPLNMRTGVSRTDVRKNFFTQRVAVDWNRIERTDKNASSIQTFKSAYRNLLSTTDGEP